MDTILNLPIPPHTAYDLRGIFHLDDSDFGAYLITKEGLKLYLSVTDQLMSRSENMSIQTGQEVIVKVISIGYDQILEDVDNTAGVAVISDLNLLH